MTFLQPAVLWGLLALAVPILIHLFYFRRYKRVYFSDTRFLQEAKRIQTSTNRLKHLLVLACRLLAFAALILAFAQPFMPSDDQQQAELSHVSIFIDNSYSMEAQGRSGSLLSMAKKEAERLVRAYPAYTKFHIFDHSFASEDQRWVSPDQALGKIAETEIHLSHHKLSEISGRQRQMQDRVNGGQTGLILITDGQDNVFDQAMQTDTSRPITVVRLAPVLRGNLLLDTAWFDSPVQLPGRSSTLYCRVTNRSDQTRRDLRVTLEVDGQTRPTSSFDLAPVASHIDTIVLSLDDQGWHDLSLYIQDASIRYDDRLDLTTYVRADASVLLIHDGDLSPTYEAAFAAIPTATLDRTKSDQVVYSSFKDYDLIILDGIRKLTSGQATALEQYVYAGGSLSIFPHLDMDASSYQSLLAALRASPYISAVDDTMTVSEVNTSSFIFKDVFRNVDRQLRMPTAYGYWRMNLSSGGDKETLLALRSGAPALIHYGRGAGHLYTSALGTPISVSDLTGSGGFFIPMLHRMSLRTTSGLAPYYVIGRSNVLSIRAPEQQAEEPYRLVGPSELIPRQREDRGRVQLFIGDDILEPGSYSIAHGSNVLGRAAFVHDRTESTSGYLSDTDMTRLLGTNTAVIDMQDEPDVAQAMVEGGGGKDWIFWLLVVALAALGLEQLLLRHYRRS